MPPSTQVSTPPPPALLLHTPTHPSLITIPSLPLLHHPPTQSIDTTPAMHPALHAIRMHLDSTHPLASLDSHHTPPTSLHPLATLLYPCPHSLTPSPSHLTRLSSLLPSFQAIPSPSTLHPHLHPSHVLSSHLSARHHRPSPRMSCQAVARAQPHFVMRSTTSNEQCSLKPNTSTSPLASLSLPPTHVSDVSLSNTPAGSDVSWLPYK